MDTDPSDHSRRLNRISGHRNVPALPDAGRRAAGPRRHAGDEAGTRQGRGRDETGTKRRRGGDEAGARPGRPVTGPDVSRQTSIRAGRRAGRWRPVTASGAAVPVSATAAPRRRAEKAEGRPGPCPGRPSRSATRRPGAERSFRPCGDTRPSWAPFSSAGPTRSHGSSCAFPLPVVRRPCGAHGREPGRAFLRNP